jgi:hypothetical protein
MIAFLVKLLKVQENARRVIFIIGFVGKQMTFPKTGPLTRLVKGPLLLQIAVIVICIKKLVHGLSCFPKLQDVPPHQKIQSMLKTLLRHPSRAIMLVLQLVQ